MSDIIDFDISGLPTPCYIVDEAALERNLKLLRSVADAAGCKILLAQKAFSMFSLYPLIGRYLDGTTASGLYEARLGHDKMGGETHVFSPAYTPETFGELTAICDHIIFNSVSQLERFADFSHGDMFGLRLNPEHSTQTHGIYDPCSPRSRLGVTEKNLRAALERSPRLCDMLGGFHMHTLCEQDSAPLAETFEAAERRFGVLFRRAKWINLGGGHHITRPGYDIDTLISLIRRIKSDYGVQVYLEPGEAVALSAGYLVSEVVDCFDNGGNIAILDASAACHMPDVLEMPYRPNVIGAGEAGEKQYTYRLGGPTCLAGDIIGDYSFDCLLNIGDRLIFCDMAIYSMVKNNTFNGMPLPAICSVGENREVRIIKRFGYDDFMCRLS